MKKQWIIAICTVSLIVGMTGCNKDTKTKQTEPTAAVTASVVPEKTIEVDKEAYNTIKDGIYTSENGEIQIKVPKDWKTIENDGSTLIVPDTEDAILDNIHVQIASKDENFASYTQTTFEESFKEKFGEVTFEKFENMTVAGLPAIKMIYKITQGSVETTEYQYMIDGNSTFIITYTNVNDLLTEEEVKTCINSLQVLR